MGKAERHGQGIGRIRRKPLRKMQQDLNHGLDLFLVRPPIAHDGLFDFQGAVFLNFHSRFGGREDRYPAGLSEEHGALHVFRVEGLFNRHEVRGEFFDLAG